LLLLAAFLLLGSLEVARRRPCTENVCGGSDGDVAIVSVTDVLFKSQRATVDEKDREWEIRAKE
jgi:2C-methyl-D-erythritol 2,4-cyclodiphosphate synthase